MMWCSAYIVTKSHHQVTDSIGNDCKISNHETEHQDHTHVQLLRFLINGQNGLGTVSYTHLTLPTIYSV